MNKLLKVLFGAVLLVLGMVVMTAYPVGMLYALGFVAAVVGVILMYEGGLRP